MLTVHGTSSRPESLASGADAPSVPRVPSSRLRARRRWVAWTGTTLILSSLLVFLFVIWRRDNTTREDRVRAMQPLVTALQARVGELGRLPASVPEMQNVVGLRYASAQERFYAQHTDTPVLIASGLEGHLILGGDGAAVIVYEAGTLRAMWMSQRELDRKLEAQREALRAFERDLRETVPDLP